MASLYILKGVNQGQRIALDADTFVLGRSPTSDLVIPATSVSRQHARIVREQGRFLLEDMQSRNGTRVNDQLIKARTPLRENDQIQICDFVAAFHVTAERTLQPSTGQGQTLEPDSNEVGESSTSIRHKVEHSSSLFLEIQSADKLKVILSASNSLRRTLELDQLLPKIADTVFELFPQADRCFIILREEHEEFRTVALKTRNPKNEAAARCSPALVKQCLDSVQALLSDEAGPTGTAVVTPDRSTMCVPLCTAENTAFGVIQLDALGSVKRFTKEDLELLGGVANQASIALENAKLHEELLAREQIELLLEQAGQVQRSILPDQVPQFPGYEFFAHYASALGVGGDYYDYIPLPQQRLAVTIGDVAGKGMPAALLMTKLCSDMRYCLLAEAELAGAVTRLNELLYPHTSRTDRFVTLAAAVLDPAQQSVTLVNAGHLTPMIYRRAARVLVEACPHEAAGRPLGLERGQRYGPCRIALEPGDIMLLYTDGVPDALNLQSARFHTKGIHAALTEGGPFSPRTLGDRIIRAVEHHAAGRSQQDDITLVCFGRTQ